MRDNLYKKVWFMYFTCHWFAFVLECWFLPMLALCSCSWKHLKVVPVLFSKSLCKRHISNCICDMFVCFGHVNTSQGWKLGPYCANSYCSKIWYSMKSNIWSTFPEQQEAHARSVCLNVIVSSNYFRPEFASI